MPDRSNGGNGNNNFIQIVLKDVTIHVNQPGTAWYKQGLSWLGKALGWYKGWRLPKS